MFCFGRSKTSSSSQSSKQARKGSRLPCLLPFRSSQSPNRPATTTNHSRRSQPARPDISSTPKPSLLPIPACSSTLKSVAPSTSAAIASPDVTSIYQTPPQPLPQRYFHRSITESGLGYSYGVQDIGRNTSYPISTSSIESRNSSRVRNASEDDQEIDKKYLELLDPQSIPKSPSSNEGNTASGRRISDERIQDVLNIFHNISNNLKLDIELYRLRYEQAMRQIDFESTPDAAECKEGHDEDAVPEVDKPGYIGPCPRIRAFRDPYRRKWSLLRYELLPDETGLYSDGNNRRRWRESQGDRLIDEAMASLEELEAKAPRAAESYGTDCEFQATNRDYERVLELQASSTESGEEDEDWDTETVSGYYFITEEEVMLMETKDQSASQHSPPVPIQDSMSQLFREASSAGHLFGIFRQDAIDPVHTDQNSRSSSLTYVGSKFSDDDSESEDAVTCTTSEELDTDIESELTPLIRGHSQNVSAAMNKRALENAERFPKIAYFKSGTEAPKEDNDAFPRLVQLRRVKPMQTYIPSGFTKRQRIILQQDEEIARGIPLPYSPLESVDDGEESGVRDNDDPKSTSVVAVSSVAERTGYSQG